MKLYHCSSLRQAMKDPASVVSLTLPIGGPLPTGPDYLQMPRLEMLYFIGTRPHQLPDEVRRLERLVRLNLGGCERFPTWLDELPQLRFLVGSFSKKPPPRTLKLPNLEHLGVGWKPGRFTTLGSTQLISLWHGGDPKLRKIPAEVGKLGRLETLDLHANQITSLPDEIGELQNLRFLLLQGNPIAELPESIQGLSNLEQLHVGKTKLKRQRAQLERWLPHTRIIW